jgi:cell division protein FtsB
MSLISQTEFKRYNSRYFSFQTRSVIGYMFSFWGNSEYVSRLTGESLTVGWFPVNENIWHCSFRKHKMTAPFGIKPIPFAPLPQRVMQQTGEVNILPQEDELITCCPVCQLFCSFGSDGLEVVCVQEQSIVYSDKSQSTFRKNVWPPKSGWKTKPWKKIRERRKHLLTAWLILVLAWFALQFWRRKPQVPPKRRLAFS